MTKAYYWDGSEVHIESSVYNDSRTVHRYRLCVDTDVPVSDPDMRYGRFNDRGWDAVPLASFPKEFRVHLLLLGVA